MSTVLEQIEQQIAKLSNKAVKKNTGTIRTVADGVAKIDGLSDVMYNEMVQFPGGAIPSIIAELSKLYHRPISATAVENPSLIAGVRVSIGDDVYERSLAAQLEALASATA